MKRLQDTRLIRCPNCGHRGTVGKKVKTTVTMECTACKVKVMLRLCIVGENGTCCRWRRPSAAAVAKAEAVKEVLSRYGGGELLDDDLNDLFSGGAK